MIYAIIQLLVQVIVEELSAFAWVRAHGKQAIEAKSGYPLTLPYSNHVAAVDGPASTQLAA